MSIKNFAAGIGAALVLLAGPASAATITGQEVRIDYLYPNIDTEDNYGGNGNGSYVVGDDVEVSLGGVFGVDISENYLNVFAGENYTLQQDVAFQGFRISSLGDFKFTSFTLEDSDFASRPTLSFDAGALYVNFAGGESLTEGDSLQARFDVAPVPVPAAGLLLMAGIGAFGALRRFSKRPVAA